MIIEYCAATPDGEILTHGICGESEIGLQFCPGASIYELPGRVGQHYVDNGEIFDIPPRPAGTNKFDYTSKSWVADFGVANCAALSRRAELLAASDWTQLPDVPLATKQAWADYRQALRDITDQSGYPLEITWPTPPGAQS